MVPGQGNEGSHIKLLHFNLEIIRDYNNNIQTLSHYIKEEKQVVEGKKSIDVLFYLMEYRHLYLKEHVAKEKKRKKTS